MKPLPLMLLCCIALPVQGEEVRRWVDEQGQVHYSNEAPAGSAEQVEKLDIPDSFDQQEYDNARRRNEETEASLKEYETEREQAEEDAARAEAERRANIKQPPPLAGPRINLPPPEYTAPSVPGKPWLGPIVPEATPLPSGAVD